MKKVLIIIAIIITLIIVSIVALFGILFSIFNKEKTSITSDQFISIMSEKNYAVVNAKSQFIEYDYINKAYMALEPNNNFQIEFYELKDSSYAVQFYNNNVSKFEESKGTLSSQSNVNLKNSSKFTMSTNGDYMVVSRINNTAIYARVSDKYKSTVDSLLKELGY